MDSTLDSSIERSPLKAVNNNVKKPTIKPKIEDIYQKKTQLEHILLRPDTYIGSVERETKQMWVWEVDNDGAGKMVNRDVSFVPGLYKIFDEILVNAADNKQRDKNMNCLRVDIDVEKNQISIYNNGKGIPVVEHKGEKMFVPTMIFGHLLTSSNYDDDQKKVVGGRNGYGAKLCNVFSKHFKVETSSREYKKTFSQVWTDNMSNAKEAKLGVSSGEDFTRITFQPDLSKFKMDKLDKDIVALFSRRAYDVAATSKGVKVYLNGKKLPVNGFKDYVDLFLKDKEDDGGNQIKVVHEVVNHRWEIAVALSDRGFQQNSFVNSIATIRGGKHVDYIAEQIVTKLTEIIKKKNKEGIKVKPFQIKNHLWVFVNCLIENPTFDSQTKETMTLASKNFGSKCIPSEKFFAAVTKVGAVESIMTWLSFKAKSDLEKSTGKRNCGKLNIPKLTDANLAATDNSHHCTLILTEGDSAKTLATSGLGVVGRQTYGVFPLRGKLLNVREATTKQIIENAEINNLIKIIGLQYKTKYESQEDIKKLRYGKVMIMADQDQDGSHIKGLVINFIHHNWPSLLKLDFLEEFITPIVKASKKDTVHSFYSLPEFEEWKNGEPDWKTFNIKYYKGLGTSTSSEAKEYFSDMNRHRIKFTYGGEDDDHHVKLAFSKKMVEQRKDWLTNSMDERKRRRELGLSELYLYEKDTSEVSYTDFVNKELVLFSNMDNERSIPSLVDGFKPGQRKVIFTCFKRNDKREVKVAQLAGSVGEHSAYHHGEASLMSTIVNLAQNYVGSNNINLLQPLGQFGTRLQGGKDAASPRYIFTLLSPLARKLFPAVDDNLLKNLYDDNTKIEPEHYVPIIPMVLVNGAEGIGTGWSTKVPNYNPREVAENIRRLIHGEEPKHMIPWFKGFTGTIDQVSLQKFVVSGQAAVLSNNTFEITELPVRTWTQTYRETVLDDLEVTNDKRSALITGYNDYTCDTKVRFLVFIPEANLQQTLAEGLHKTFKLQSTISNTSMVLFDRNGVIKRYDTPEEIMHEFYHVRLEFYVKRKAFLEGLLEAERLFNMNKARFILEKNEGKIKMENISQKDFIAQLIKLKYDPDPVKAFWTKWNREQEDKEVEVEPAGVDKEDDGMRADYGYLYNMRMASMLLEKVARLVKERDEKTRELEELRRTSPKTLWERDIDAFLAELDVVEQKEREQEEKDWVAAAELAKKSREAGKKGKMARDDKLAPNKKKKKTKDVMMLAHDPKDYKPTEGVERIEPKIDLEKFQPKVKKVPKKTPTAGPSVKREATSGSDSDEYMTLEQRIGKKTATEKKKKEDPTQLKITSLFSAAATEDNNMKSEDDLVKPMMPATKKLKLKQSTLNFQPANKGPAAPVAKATTSTNIVDVSDSDVEEVAPVKPKPKKKAATKAAKASEVKRKSSDFDDDSEDDFAPKKPTKKAKKTVISDSESDLSDVKVIPSQSSNAARLPARRQRKPINYKAVIGSDSDFSESEPSEQSTIEEVESDDLLD